MTFDIYTNRIPFGLLTDEEQSLLKAHNGAFEGYSNGEWVHHKPSWYPRSIYRAVREPVETVTEHLMWLTEHDDLYYMCVTGIPVTVRITRRDGKFVRGEVLSREEDH